MLNNPTFLLLFTMSGSIFLYYILTKSIRDFITPWAFAYMLWVLIYGAGTTGFLHFVMTSFNFIIIMILSNGCNIADARKNPVWTSFLVFWGYLIISGWFGLFPYATTVSYLTTLLISFGTGFFMAMWVVKTEGSLHRLVNAVAWSAIAFSVYSIMHGGFTNAGMSDSGRIALDASTFEGEFQMNHNSMAGYVLCYLPFLILGFLFSGKDFKTRITKVISLVAIILMTLLLVRSGSRAGGVGLLPCCLYFIYSTKDKAKRAKRIFLFSVSVVLVGVGVIVSMQGVERLRAFDLKNEELTSLYGDGFSLDRISSGRMRIYENLISEMSSLQMMFGRGLVRSVYEKGSEVKGKVAGGNDHSSYVSIFLRGGFVGLFLFLIFVIVFVQKSMMMGDRGRLALFLLGVWMAQNIGESWGINGGRISILLGMGIGFLTNQRIMNTELMSDHEKRFHFGEPYLFYA